jgi:DNA-binding GntR family transcriptional regulator
MSTKSRYDAAPDMAVIRLTTSRRTRAGLGLGDLAYQQIKQDIVSCALKPGQALTETELTLKYRLGKAPVRAALMRLGQESLVRAVPRRGYVVRPLTVKDVQDLFEFRRLLEPPTAALAAGRLRPEDLRHLKALCRADTANGTAFNRANTEFHVAVARAAGNEYIAEALSRILDQMERLFHLRYRPSDQAIALRAHRSLVEALRTGDKAAAAEIAADHIDDAREKVMEAVLSSSDVMAVQIGERRVVRR